MDYKTGLVIGDFQIEERLGAGGMGVVFRARQLSLNRSVALKVLGNSIQSETGIARFRREAQAIAKLKHPNIAGILYIGQDDKLCYMAMEFVDGVNFREVIRRVQICSVASMKFDDAIWKPVPSQTTHADMRFDLPPTLADSDQPLTEIVPASSVSHALSTQQSYVRRCVELVRDVATALAYAHEQGVIHRDIKPENLLLDRTGKVTVIDFGLARFYEDETITYTGQLVGTPLYMSPEQILGGKDITAQSDVYSLGMVLYELLTLEPPIAAPNRESLFRQIVMRALPPVSWKNVSVPESLTAVVHHALAKDSEDRYKSMRAFVEDLESFLLGKPVSAPTYRYRFDEQEIRAKRPVAVLYLSFFCFFLAMTTGIWSVIILSFAFVDSREDFSVFSLVTALLVISLFAYGHSLLAGRTWTKPTGQILGVLFAGLSAFALLMSLRFAGASFRAIRVPWYMLAILSGGASPAFLAVLFHPRVREWFKFASDARVQFRGPKRNAKIAARSQNS